MKALINSVVNSNTLLLYPVQLVQEDFLCH